MINFITRHQANDFYADILRDAELSGSVEKTMNELGRRDLFFLLTRLLGRKDINRDWLFDRCKEIQAKPNGHLDLWAREHYKSTIITFGKTIQDILDSHSSDSFYWDKEITVGIFSHTRPIAKAFLKQIMFEFQTNALLKQVYPDVLYENPYKDAASWSIDNGIIVKRRSNPKEATVEAWGLVDGQPTSKHFDILLYDDVVTRESVTTPEQIQKTTAAWELSLNLGAHGGVQRYIGTRYHFNDTYKTIIERGITGRVHAATHDGTPTGRPVFLDRASLEEKRRLMGPYTFASQMLQNPKAEDAMGFREEWIRYYDAHPYHAGYKAFPKDWNYYLLCDPAGEKKRGNDYTVMAVVALAPDQNYYLVDGIRDRLNLKERTDKLFYFHRKYKPLATGYEKYGKDSDIEHIKEKMNDEGYHFGITPLGGATPKNDRIMKLVPVFADGRFYLPYQLLYTDYEDKTQDFVATFKKDEYLAFPHSAHDDMLDCLARIRHTEFGAVFPDNVQTFEPKREYNALDWARRT